MEWCKQAIYTKRDSMAYVYSHTRVDTGEIFYIGIGSDTRYSRAFTKKGRNKYWHKIASKTDYRVTILLDGLTWDEACNEEIMLIKELGRKSEGGLLVNITEGGEGFKSNHSQKTKDQIRDFYKGKSYEDIYGQDRAETQRANRSGGVKKVWQMRSAEEKQIISEKISKKTIGKKVPIEVVRKSIEARRKYRNIECYTKKGEYVKTYAVLEDVILDGFSRHGVRSCLVGTNGTHKQFIWKYKNI